MVLQLTTHNDNPLHMQPFHLRMSAVRGSTIVPCSILRRTYVPSSGSQKHKTNSIEPNRMRMKKDLIKKIGNCILFVSTVVTLSKIY